MTGQLFLSHSTSKLIQMTAYLETCLGKLDDHQIWNRAHPSQNSIGNLVLHLCGNVRQWIGSTLGGSPDIRHRDGEFSPLSKTSELVPLLRTTVSNAVEILSTLPPERLTETVTTQDGDRTVLEVIYQVVGHFQQHTGQIIFATKLATAQDLQFYKKSS